MSGSISHYRLAHSPQGRRRASTACSESVILPMCNVIYLGMQRYLSRGPRAEAAERAGRGARTGARRRAPRGARGRRGTRRPPAPRVAARRARRRS